MWDVQAIHQVQSQNLPLNMSFNNIYTSATSYLLYESLAWQVWQLQAKLPAVLGQQC